MLRTQLYTVNHDPQRPRYVTRVSEAIHQLQSNQLTMHRWQTLLRHGHPYNHTSLYESKINVTYNILLQTKQFTFIMNQSGQKLISSSGINLSASLQTFEGETLISILVFNNDSTNFMIIIVSDSVMIIQHIKIELLCFFLR